MVVNGHYMALRVRIFTIPSVVGYGKFVLNEILAPLRNLDDTANAIENDEFARLGSQAASYEDRDVDMGAHAERAFNKGLAFYETMSSLRQAILNLVAAGLFHLTEQHLAELCHVGAITVAPPHDTRLEIVRKWYQTHFQLDLSSLAPWSKIDELRLVANVSKHGEGGSAEELRKVRPELFRCPSLRELPFNISKPHIPIGMPLAGDDLYVTEQLFREYYEAAKQLFKDIVNHFETHEEDPFGD